MRRRSRPARARRAKPKPPYKSTTEEEFAERLRLLKACGSVDSWSYESAKFLYGSGWYTPDFKLLAGGHIIIVEVKGGKKDKRSQKIVPYWRSDGPRIRYRNCAKMNPGEVWVAAFKYRSRWIHEAYYAEDQGLVDELFGGGR